MIHPSQEADVVPGHKLLITGGGVIAAIVLCVLVAWGLGRCSAVSWSDARRMPATPIPREVNAIETTVFASEAQGIEGNQRAEAYLHEYGWVDPKAQIIHVPIEVAFDLYLSRRAKAAPQASSQQPRPAGQPPGAPQLPQGAPSQGRPPVQQPARPAPAPRAQGSDQQSPAQAPQGGPR